MNTIPNTIYNEYKAARDFKDSIGDRGIYEQSRINERFYRGDQWYGVNTSGDKPLVRHNVIKRIADFKLSRIMSDETPIKYFVDNIAYLENDRKNITALKDEIIKSGKAALGEKPDNAEMNLIAKALSKNRELCAERLGFKNLCAKALRDAYVTGTGILYTFWDQKARGGTGDIGCEVLSVNDVFFSDPHEKDIEKQKYIIITGVYDTDRVLREAKQFEKTVDEKSIIKDSVGGKVLTFTKLYKEYTKSGEEIVMCVKSTESAVIRRPFRTFLSKYPINVFCFEERDDCVYGDSEVTYLIPNQIAINRMITANVWSSMSTGIPIMVVNGDSVTSEITNDPGQIIKVYGTNEDVKGAVNFISPPDYSKDFCENINSLIQNTLTQSGATAAVLGDEILNNATALSYLRGSAFMSLDIIKERFLAFRKNVATIWADFFINCYGERPLKMKEGENVYYIPFSSSRYDTVVLTVETDTDTETKEEEEK